MQSIDISPFEHGFKQCFADRNKYIKKYIVAEFESLYSSVDKATSPDEKENFHELLMAATNTHLLRTYVGLKRVGTIS